MQSYEDASFLGQKCSTCPKQKHFWKKLLISFSSSCQPLSLGKIIKKFLLQIHSYEDAPFFGPKLPIFPNEIFFQETC